jgi:hypothetical protein
LSVARHRGAHFRLEAIGTWLRAYVNGDLLLQVRDDAHTHGKAGLALFRARADYDNVVISTNPQTVLLADSFSRTRDERLTPWETSPPNVWSYAVQGSGATVFSQSLTDVHSLAVNGGTAEDQSIEFQVRPRASGTAPWHVGAIARYVDYNNYYYVRLWHDDRIVLGRMRDGREITLDDAPLNVQIGTVFRVRFEAIGSALRAYVQNRFVLEAEDSSFESGQYGIETRNVAATVDNFRATRP